MSIESATTTGEPLSQRSFVQANESMSREEILRILMPLKGAIVAKRLSRPGIIVVNQERGPVYRRKGQEFAIETREVIGLSCKKAAQICKHDPVQRQWCSVPPQPGQIKVFLHAGGEIHLVTLDIQAKGEIDATVIPCGPCGCPGSEVTNHGR